MQGVPFDPYPPTDSMSSDRPVTEVRGRTTQFVALSRIENILHKQGLTGEVTLQEISNRYVYCQSNLTCSLVLVVRPSNGSFLFVGKYAGFHRDFRCYRCKSGKRVTLPLRKRPIRPNTRQPQRVRLLLRAPHLEPIVLSAVAITNIANVPCRQVRPRQKSIVLGST